MHDEGHVSEAEWTRLWAHTLSAEDRRRITAAVKGGHVLDDPHEALLAAELARRMRTPRPRTTWLLWANALLGLLIAAQLVTKWPDLDWTDLLLPAIVAINVVNILSSGRRRPTDAALQAVEQGNLVRSRTQA